MVQHADEFDALRMLVDALRPFEKDVRGRLLRWAEESLALAKPGKAAAPAAAPAAAAEPKAVRRRGRRKRRAKGKKAVTAPVAALAPVVAGAAGSVQAFMAQKKPRSDVQFAAAVAYYFRHAAPAGQRKDGINGDDLQKAALQSGRGKFQNANQTLNNTRRLGYLDKGKERGSFCINSAGEKLIGTVLPQAGGKVRATGAKRKARARRAVRKVARKVAAKKK